MICHRCQHRQKKCRGACACGIDGADIIVHATSGQCPIGLFTTPEAAMTAGTRATDRAQWPALARTIAVLRREGDAGIGDTVARCLHLVGADTIAKAYELITGRECGCSDRQAALNAIYPYSVDGN
jgi:hypothetical protein